jgi:hypothetical protein
MKLLSFTSLAGISFAASISLLGTGISPAQAVEKLNLKVTMILLMSSIFTQNRII